MDIDELARIPGVNPQVPNAARVYDYILGGTHNFESDRQAAEYMCSLVPSTRKWLRMIRACLQTAARRLGAEGFTHWVDFASGLPTSDHVHTVLPDAKVIYTDINPLTIVQGRALIGDNPNVCYHECDIRQARKFLHRPDVNAFLGGNRKVVFGANGITVFLPAADNRKFFRDLYDWAEPGSKLFTTFETKSPDLTTPRWEQFVGMFQQMGEAFHLFSLPEYLELCKPWTPVRNGVMTVREFLGLPPEYITEEDREGVGIEFYAAILEKTQ